MALAEHLEGLIIEPALVPRIHKLSSSDPHDDVDELPQSTFLAGETANETTDEVLEWLAATATGAPDDHVLCMAHRPA
jgi:hypothetical protein